MARFFVSQSQSVAMRNQSNHEITFDTQLKTVIAENVANLLTDLLPGYVNPQWEETSSRLVEWGLYREIRETTGYVAPGEWTVT